MKDETALQVQEQRPTDLLQVIAAAVADPRCDVEKMERLLAMQERVMADQRKTAFMAALARLTPKLPEIGKNGTSHHGKYSRLEDIDRAIRPLLGEEGFSLSFDSEQVGKDVKVTCKLSHEQGHSESKTITLPVDTSGSKNPAQAVISTVSYGRRALTKMFFNLIEAGEDTDGNDPTTITEEQVRDLEAAIQELKINRDKFLVFMHVSDLREILAKDLPTAINAIDVKRRGVK